MSLKPYTYSLVVARKASSLFNPKALPLKTPKDGGNLPTLSVGVNQRNQVLPKDPTLEGNKKGIGFYQPNYLDSAVWNCWVNQLPNMFTRHVRIFYADIEKSQKVPAIRRTDQWIVQFERGAVFKNPHMGWTFVTDTISKRPVRFKTLEEAIEHCRLLGLGFEIHYPNFRYHTKKNYGDNFKWQGHPKADVEDL